ncbi:MAG: hypothetical protein J4400_00375 [Candidatus Aenigmarchaeota archaeon]|nr:hypothetical protein [Candidatus Aenigmarchaeota archaeon]
MRLPIAAALVVSLFSMPAGAQTYEQSIGEKERAPCVRQAMSNYKGLTDFVARITKARREVQDIVYNSSLSDADKLAELRGLPQRYGECVAVYGIFNPVGESFYERMGRKKPPLAGTYDEQAAAVVREAGWQREAADAYARNAKREAGRRIRTTSQVIDIIGNLPDAINADINIDGWNVSGTIWPRFNVSYGEQGTIVIRPNASLPDNGRLESESGRFRLYSFPGGGYVLFGGGGAYSSYSRDGLLKYGDFQETQRDTLRERGQWMFGEFSKFINRLGGSFDGDARFKVSRTSRYLGDKPISFEQYGFRAQNNAAPKRLAVGAYYNIGLPPGAIDDDYIDAFNAAFDELSFGGQRRIMHLSPATGHSGRHAGVMEIESRNVGYSGLYIILEELQ